jgi:hypothetical protein
MKERRAGNSSFILGYVTKEILSNSILEPNSQGLLRVDLDERGEFVRVQGLSSGRISAVGAEQPNIEVVQAIRAGAGRLIA